MKISHIREFLLLAVNKNYSKTAEELYIAQSALSRHIASMEDELGVKLIKRSTTNFELTEDGIKAVEGFRKVMEDYNNTLQSFSTFSGFAKGELRLGIMYYDIIAYVAKIRNAFLETYPNITLKLISFQPEQAEQALLNDKVDAILAYNAMPSPEDNLRVFPFLKIPNYVYFERSHRFSRQHEIFVKDLDNEIVISPASALRIQATKQLFENMYSENHVHIGTEVPVSNFDEIPMIVQDHHAVFVTPMANPNAYRDALEYRELEPEHYHSSISVVWKASSDNAAINALINTIKIIYS